MQILKVVNTRTANKKHISRTLATCTLDPVSRSESALSEPIVTCTAHFTARRSGELGLVELRKASLMAVGVALPEDPGEVAFARMLSSSIVVARRHTCHVVEFNLYLVSVEFGMITLAHSSIAGRQLCKHR